MKVVIIEDEPVARQWLVGALQDFDPAAAVVGELDSVEATVAWFENHEPPDLVISDIELTDGPVFDALERRPVGCPIIFVTAYDQFVLRAFEDNGIAYLLKPVERDKFEAALGKYERLRQSFCAIPATVVEQLRRAVATPNYRQRLVVKRTDGIHLLPVDTIAYMRTRDEVLSAYDRHGVEFALRETLKELETILDPAKFHRINRSEMVHIAAIDRLDAVGPERLMVRLVDLDVELISSAGRTPGLRRWLKG